MLWLLEKDIWYKQLYNINSRDTDLYTYFCTCRNYDSSPDFSSLESFSAEDGSENSAIAKEETIEDISDIVDTGT